MASSVTTKEPSGREIEVQLGSHAPLLSWLSAHRGKRSNLVITLKQSNRLEPDSETRADSEQARLRKMALEYDISLGDRVLKSKMKGRAASLGVRECLVLKFDLLSEFVKEYMYEEVALAPEPARPVRLRLSELESTRETLFAVEAGALKYLDRSVSGKTVFEFAEGSICFGEDDPFAANKLVLEPPNLAEYDFARVRALLGHAAVKVSSRSLFDMIRSSRRFFIERVAVQLGRRSGSGWHFHVLFQADFCSLGLRFSGARFLPPPHSQPPPGQSQLPGFGATPAEPGPNLPSKRSPEPPLERPLPPARRGRLFSGDSQAWPAHPQSQRNLCSAPKPTQAERGPRDSRVEAPLNRIEERERSAGNSQVRVKPEARLFETAEGAPSQRELQR